MSDNWIYFVPDDPRYVPDKGQIEIAVREASRLFPRADSVEPELPPDIEFFHAVLNITCRTGIIGNCRTSEEPAFKNKS